MKTKANVVLITGGATGIGYALAKKFFYQGNEVILVSRNNETLLSAARSLQGVRIFAADITKKNDRQAIVKCFPTVNILVNNAGSQLNKPIAECSEQEIEDETAVNFTAHVLLTRDFLPILLGQESSSIINITSGLAIVPKQSAAIYCAAKAAFHSFSRTLRWQLEKSNISVFEVIPSLVDTAMTAGRGKSKITPDQLVEEFWRDFKNNQFEIRIGKTKTLMWLNRILPSVAERIMRHGL